MTTAGHAAPLGLETQLDLACYKHAAPTALVGRDALAHPPALVGRDALHAGGAGGSSVGATCL